MTTEAEFQAEYTQTVRDVVFEALTNAVENGYTVKEPYIEAADLKDLIGGFEDIDHSILARYVKEWKETDGA